MHAGGTKEIYEIYQLSVTDRYKKGSGAIRCLFRLKRTSGKSMIKDKSKSNAG